MNSNAASRGLTNKVLLVFLIHRRKVDHVRQEDVDLDDLLNGRIGRKKDRFDVGNAGRRLLTNGTVDQIPSRICGYLTRDVDERRSDDGLRLLRRPCQFNVESIEIREEISLSPSGRRQHT